MYGNGTLKSAKVILRRDEDGGRGRIMEVMKKTGICGNVTTKPPV
jgi:hypothetical protein